jgi:hypothetical protein
MVEAEANNNGINNLSTGAGFFHPLYVILCMHWISLGSI